MPADHTGPYRSSGDLVAFVFVQIWRFCKPMMMFVSMMYFRIINILFITIHFFTTKISVPPPSNHLLMLSATHAAQMIRQKQLKSIDLVEQYILRIQAVDPLINAIARNNFEEARKLATDIDTDIAALSMDELDALAKTKPLLGVPFTLKDSIEVQGLPCTNGLYSRKDSIAEADATVVSRMRNAGAVLLAVTNVPEACLWWETSNTLYGRSSNPYDLRRSTAGSSGGEAALVACAATPIGIGSDIGGSVRMPSFFNGVFGMVSTPGIVPLKGHLPVSIPGYRAQMLRIGAICRFAEDLEIMLNVLAGDDVSKLDLHVPFEMKNMKIYYMEGIQSPLVEKVHADMLWSLKRTVKFFELKYDLVAWRVDLPLVQLAVEFFMASMFCEGEPTFAEHLADLQGTVNCAVELCKWPFGFSRHTLPALITGLIDNKNGPFPKNVLAKLRYQRDILRRQIVQLLGEDGILIFPSLPHTAPFHHQSLFKPLNFAYTALFNTLGLPVVQCPVGLSIDSVPLGIQIIGAPHSERLLLRCAEDIEEGFGGWVPPSSHAQ